MANTSQYEFSKNIPEINIPGFYPNADGLLIYRDNKLKGLSPFGTHCGVITEDDLTDEVVEFLLTRKDSQGNLIYKDFLVKKTSEKTTAK